MDDLVMKRSVRILSIILSLIVMQKEASPQATQRDLTGQVTVFNAGYSGNNTADLLARIDKDVFSHKPQLVILLIGTNDMLNERNRLTMAEFERNYRKLIRNIKRSSRLVLMTIPPVNSGYIVKRKPQLNFTGNEPEELVDSANAVIKRLAFRNHCTLIDLHKILTGCGGSNVSKESLFQNEANSGIDDGVHPTYDGYRVIASAVFQTIRTKWPRAVRIVCFGDSITFGYRMKGAGSSHGRSYPGILQAMFEDS